MLLRIWQPVLLLLFIVPALSAPQGTPPELDRALAALYRGDIPLAGRLSQKYAAENPDSATGRIVLGQVLMAANRFEQAFAELRQALRLEPENLDALYFLGKVSLILGQMEFEKLRRMAPQSARVHQLLGESYQLQNKNEEAEKEFHAALQADPNLTDVLIALADMKRLAFHYDEARALYLKVLAWNPNDFDATYGLGVCHLRQEQPREAAEYFRRAVAADPASPVARFGLGSALMRQQQLGPAVEEFKHAITLEPAMRQAYIMLGRAYQQLGRHHEAREAFRTSRELFESDILDPRRRLDLPDPAEVAKPEAEMERVPR